MQKNYRNGIRIYKLIAPIKRKIKINKTFLLIYSSYIIGAPKKKRGAKMEIEEIVTRCKNGEKEAFRELLQTVEKKALATAYFLSGNRGIAEDILQETYMKCFMEINKLQEPQAFKVWFFKILMRTGWKMTKKQSELVPLEITSENECLFFDENQEKENIIDSYEIKHVM